MAVGGGWQPTGTPGVIRAPASVLVVLAHDVCMMCPGCIPRGRLSGAHDATVLSPGTLGPWQGRGPCAAECGGLPMVVDYLGGGADFAKYSEDHFSARAKYSEDHFAWPAAPPAAIFHKMVDHFTLRLFSPHARPPPDAAPNRAH